MKRKIGDIREGGLTARAKCWTSLEWKGSCEQVGLVLWECGKFLLGNRKEGRYMDSEAGELIEENYLIFKQISLIISIFSMK